MGSEQHVTNQITGSVTGSVIQAGAVHGGVHLHTPKQTTRVPKQLVAAPQLFIGRTQELEQLDKSFIAGTATVTTVSGAGGVGKTALALHWSWEHLDAFPDGQLYVNLRGFDITGPAMLPEIALRGFLEALGVDSQAMPVGMDARAALYRGLVADKQMLIVLDNATDTSQVEPLLPGSPTCITLVTSRHHLAGLISRGARMLQLATLGDVDARKLLGRHVGIARLAADPTTTNELVGNCGGLPLALVILAARIRRHPSFPLTRLATELGDESGRLDALDTSEITASIRSVLSTSYRILGADRARLFCMLSLIPGPDVSIFSAASLADLMVPQARLLLRDLEDAHLLMQLTPDRYRMHDLTRLYAVDRAKHDLPQATRQAALRRLVDFYLHTAYAGDRLLNPHRPEIQLSSTSVKCAPLAHATDALNWFDAEHICLLGAQQAALRETWTSEVWQLAWALTTFHLRRGHLDEQLIAWRAGVEAAVDLGDVAVETLAHRRLGDACARAGHHSEAIGYLQRSLEQAEQRGDLTGSSHAHRTLAHAWEHRADYQQASNHAACALRLFQAINAPTREADALSLIGSCAARLGRHDEARSALGDALALSRRHNHSVGSAGALNSLGDLAQQTGHHVDARDYYQEALALYRSLGHTYIEADVLHELGRVNASLGHRDAARNSWLLALELYKSQQRATAASNIQQSLETLDKQSNTINL